MFLPSTTSFRIFDTQLSISNRFAVGASYIVLLTQLNISSNYRSPDLQINYIDKVVAGLSFIISPKIKQIISTEACDLVR